MSDICSFQDGIIIKPDGVHELDPCIYETVEAYQNVSIEIRRCKNCGKIDIVWKRQGNTEEIDSIDQIN